MVESISHLQFAFDIFASRELDRAAASKSVEPLARRRVLGSLLQLPSLPNPQPLPALKARPHLRFVTACVP
jgi:hypothetical protein